MDCSPPGSSVHGILQARILGWVAIPFSRGFSRLRDREPTSLGSGGFFTIRATWLNAWISLYENKFHKDFIYYFEDKIYFKIRTGDSFKILLCCFCFHFPSFNCIVMGLFAHLLNRDLCLMHQPTWLYLVSNFQRFTSESA